MHVIRTAILLSFILITSRQNAIAQPPNRDAVMASMKTAASYLVDHVLRMAAMSITIPKTCSNAGAKVLRQSIRLGCSRPERQLSAWRF